MKLVYLDTETTGLQHDDEVVEIAILSQNDDVLLNTLIKPRFKKTWNEAQRIHGISPDDVKNAPYLDDLKSDILDAVSDSIICIYNSAYDLNYIPYLIPFPTHCVMRHYSHFAEVWDDYRDDYKWHRLAHAASDCGYTFKGPAHRALSDCRATKAVMEYMISKKAWDYIPNDQF